MTDANSYQINGNHYHAAIQTWDFIVANKIEYLPANCIKYLVRYKSKGGIDDLRKARHYLDKLIEVELELEELQSQEDITQSMKGD